MASPITVTGNLENVSESIRNVKKVLCPKELGFLGIPKVKNRWSRAKSHLSTSKRSSETSKRSSARKSWDFSGFQRLKNVVPEQKVTSSEQKVVSQAKKSLPSVQNVILRGFPYRVRPSIDSIAVPPLVSY